MDLELWWWDESGSVPVGAPYGSTVWEDGDWHAVALPRGVERVRALLFRPEYDPDAASLHRERADDCARWAERLRRAVASPFGWTFREGYAYLVADGIGQQVSVFTGRGEDTASVTVVYTTGNGSGLRPAQKTRFTKRVPVQEALVDVALRRAEKYEERARAERDLADGAERWSLAGWVFDLRGREVRFDIRPKFLRSERGELREDPNVTGPRRYDEDLLFDYEGRIYVDRKEEESEAKQRLVDALRATPEIFTDTSRARVLLLDELGRSYSSSGPDAGDALAGLVVTVEKTSDGPALRTRMEEALRMREERE